MVRNKALGPKEVGQKYRDGFDDFLNKSFKKDKFNEDYSKLKKLQTKI